MGLLEQASLVITPNAVKTGKLYSVIPNDGTGDLDVVRATSATRVNSAGLIEIPVTNLFLQSDMFANATWSKGQSSVVANSIIAPDGTLTADTLTADGTSAQHAISQAFSTTNGMTYTTSVYAKKNTNNFLQISGFAAGFGTTAFVNFDLSNGVLGTIGSGSNGSIQSVGDGWYRCVATFTATATASAGLLFFMITSATSIRGESNTLSTSVYLWGAQLQEGVTATEYIPTTSVIRTRFAGITQDGGSASNIPRIDYTNGSCPSILVEPQRTNLLLRSEEFDNASWNKEATTITPNVSIAPNGNLSADKIIATATNANHIAYNYPVSFVSSQYYTFSYYAKLAEYTKTAIRIGGPGYSIVNRAEINLSNGTIIYQQGFTSLQVQSVGNGWYRIQGTFVSASDIVANIQPLSDSYSVSSDNYTFLGDGTSGIFVWGAQLEAGSNATSYIPTVASTVTRVADRNNIILTNKTFWNKNNFTIYWEGTFLNGSYNQATFGFGNVTDIVASGAAICFYVNGVGFFMKQDGTSPGGLTIGTPLPNGSNYKLIIKREGTEIKWFRNGVLLGERTGEVVDYTYLGLNSGSSTYYLNKSFMIPSSLTDQQCIDLTAL